MSSSENHAMGRSRYLGRRIGFAIRHGGEAETAPERFRAFRRAKPEPEPEPAAESIRNPIADADDELDFDGNGWLEHKRRKLDYRD